MLDKVSPEVLDLNRKIENCFRLRGFLLKQINDRRL